MYLSRLDSGNTQGTIQPSNFLEVANVRLGSKTELGAGVSHFRFTPNTRHCRLHQPCPKSANSGLMQCSKKTLFDHFVGAPQKRVRTSEYAIGAECRRLAQPRA